LSDCARLYAQALIDPFVPLPKPACIPDLLEVPSKKVFLLQRGTFQTGTTGNIGYVVASSLGQVTNSGTSYWYSDSTYASTSLPATSAATGNNLGEMLQAPYSVGQLAGFQSRTVAMGVRIRYLGTELNRGGRIIPFLVNTTQTMQGASIAAILGRNENRSSPNTRNKWHCVTYYPSQATDFNYTSNSGAITNSTNMDIGIIADGCVAGSAFEYEIGAHIEYVSAGSAVDSLTASHTDLPGLSAIKGFFEAKSVTAVSPAETMSEFQKYLSRYTNTVDVSGFITSAVPYVGAAARAGYSYLASNPLMLTG